MDPGQRLRRFRDDIETERGGYPGQRLRRFRDDIETERGGYPGQRLRRFRDDIETERGGYPTARGLTALNPLSAPDKLFPSPRTGRILAPMTQARTCAHGLATPSLPQHWLAALLRMFVELVLNVASFLQMRARRLPAECHSDVTPTALPEGQSDITKEEPAHAPDSALVEPSPTVSRASHAIHLPLSSTWGGNNALQRDGRGDCRPHFAEVGEVDCAPLRARRRGQALSTSA